MATINGVSFNMQNLSIVSEHRNIPSDQPGSDLNFITDMGYDGLVLRLEGFESSLATYDAVMAEFMGAGTQTLVPNSGYQFSVYSAQKTNDLLEGFTTNYYPYDLILYTSTPYRESTTLSCRAKEITTNNQTWSAEDASCNNIVPNWSFETWSAGASAAPDGWILGGTGATIARESTIVKHDTYSAKITSSSTNEAYLEYKFYDEDYDGETMTVGAWVYSNVAGTAKIMIIDGSGSTSSSYHTGSGDWEWLTASRELDTLYNGYFMFRCTVINTISTIGYFDAYVVKHASSIADSTLTREITTSGNVDALPDIKVKGGDAVATYARSGYTYTDTDTTEYSTTSGTYVLKKTYTFTAHAGTAFTLDTIGMDLKEPGSTTCYGKATYQAASLNGGAETDVPGGSFSTVSDTYVSFSVTDLDIDCAGNETLTVKFYVRSGNGIETNYMKNLDIQVSYRRKDVCKNAQIYNTTDSTVTSQPGNELEPDMIASVNTDGSGSLVYTDDFTTTKYLDAMWYWSGTTYDSSNDELDFGNSEYIIYKIDTKYPITGIPTLTSKVDIDTGTPTLKISSDGVTFYDIDTAIVDNVYTEYELHSTDNLTLKGLTEFYWKLNFDGSSTGSLVQFKLEIDTSTIDAEHPRITTGGDAVTFKCDQHADSGLNCTVQLSYRDRSWA